MSMKSNQCNGKWNGWRISALARSLGAGAAKQWKYENKAENIWKLINDSNSWKKAKKKESEEISSKQYQWSVKWKWNIEIIWNEETSMAPGAGMQSASWKLLAHLAAAAKLAQWQ